MKREDLKSIKVVNDSGKNAREIVPREKTYKEKVKENLKKIRKLPLTDRLVVHGRNNVPWRQNIEEYAECLDQSTKLMQDRLIDEIIDLNNGEKEFFILWNSFLTSLHGVQGGICFRNIPQVVRDFIRLYDADIVRKKLYRNLTLHLTILGQESVLGSQDIAEALEEVQTQAAAQGVLEEMIAHWALQRKPRASSTILSDSSVIDLLCD